nr:unnamed protein product [Callosobruchus analis]
MLAQSGIYNEEAIEKFRDHMFPTEKQAITNIIAQGVNRMNPDLQHLSLSGLLDDDTLERITQGYIDKMWGAFVWIGNTMSGVMGIWFIWKVTCFCWNTIIHGLSLYKTFGISLHLLTAVSGSLSHYFLHKHTSSNKREDQEALSSDRIEDHTNKELDDQPKDQTVTASAPSEHIIIRHDKYPQYAPTSCLGVKVEILSDVLDSAVEIAECKIEDMIIVDENLDPLVSPTSLQRSEVGSKVIILQNLIVANDGRNIIDRRS